MLLLLLLLLFISLDVEQITGGLQTSCKSCCPHKNDVVRGQDSNGLFGKWYETTSLEGGGGGGGGGIEGSRSGVEMVDVVVVVEQQLLTTARRSQSGGFSMEGVERENRGRERKGGMNEEGDKGRR